MTNEQQPVKVVIDPAAQVSSPSVGLLVTGVIGGILSLLGLILNAIGTSVIPFVKDSLDERYMDLWEGAAGIASSFIGIVIAVFIIYAALKMKELSQYGLCMAASILAIIPCISPCCIIGLPIGIWCLVVLTRPDVKAAFH